MIRRDAAPVVTHQLVTFQLAGQEYAVEIGQVREIIRHEDVTQVPRAPEFVEGVLNLRGRVIPVIDLRRRFSLPVGERSAAERIMVVDTSDRTVGVVVDAVTEVLRVAEAAVEPPPPLVAGLDQEYLRGVAKIGTRLIVWLDLARILTSRERIQLEQFESHPVAGGMPGPSVAAS